MKIIRAIVNKNNWTAGRDGNKPSRIVLHTMVGTVAGSQARFNDPKAQVSAHYGIGLDGTVYVWVDEANTAYHAGKWNMNLVSIGIEHEDKGKHADSKRTAALYASSAQIVANICRHYGIPCNSKYVIKHKEVVATACPGGLDTARIIKQANAILNPPKPAPKPTPKPVSKPTTQTPSLTPQPIPPKLPVTPVTPPKPPAGQGTSPTPVVTSVELTLLGKILQLIKSWVWKTLGFKWFK